MSRWTDDFKAHQFHVDWEILEKTLGNGVVPEGADQIAFQEIGRLRKVLAYIGTTLEGVDPELANPSLLLNLQSQVQAAAAEVREYFTHNNINNLRNANNNADAMATLVAQSPSIPSGVAKTALTKAATAYQDVMEEYARRYDSKMQSLTVDSEARVTALGQKMDSANEAVTKLDGRIAAMETQLPTQLAGYNATFQVSETQRSDRYEGWTLAYQQKLDEQFATAASKYSVVLDVLGDYQDRAGKVLGSVVDTAQAGAYATYASEEKQSANSYRRYAMLLMGAAALVLFMPEIAHFIREASTYTFDWQKAVYRLPFSLVLFAPALYLAKESSKHRTNEVANRRRQHILTTIGPYLALLEPKRAEEIKAEVAKSIFSDSVPVFDDKTGEASNVVAQISNLVTTVLKQSKGR